LNLLLGGRTPETLFSASVPRPGDRLLPLKYPAGQEIEGRYGWRANDNANPIGNSDTLADLATRVALPGRNGEDDPASKDDEAGLLAVPEGNRGWAVDLQARLQTSASPSTGPVPSLAYAKADTTSEFQDDPYELLLDYDRRRTELNDPRTTGQGPSPIPDNPFSPAELERILRVSLAKDKRQRYPTARTTIELRKDDAVDPSRSVKSTRLGKSVLPRRAIQHEQHLDGTRRGNFRYHSSNLGELVHQTASRLHATGGVNDHGGEVTRRSEGERIVNGGCGIATWTPLNHLNSFAHAECPQLVDRRCAEGICSNEEG
jgi:hypothetical protein